MEDWRLRKWRVARVPRFAAHLFAHRFVLVPAANKQRNTRAVRTRSLILRARQAHRNWLRRLQELFLRDLWTPASSFLTRDLQLASVQRCLNCRPTSFEYYWTNNIVKLNPCGRFAICPFCYARRAEDLFRRVICATWQLRKTTDKAIVACRIEKYTIQAPNFAESGWDATVVFANIPVLRRAILAEIANYKKIRRQLSRETYGSAWAIVVEPVNDGWEIQIRQLFISRLKARKPVSRAKTRSAIFLQSARITNIDSVINVVGSFVEYPRGLLAGYAELSAAALHARTNLRLTNATGCLYRRNTPQKAQKETNFLPDVP